MLPTGMIFAGREFLFDFELQQQRARTILLCLNATLGHSTGSF